jgi:glyoxylase-like metal-dependent hydrolase (beta-lactamase superfamily II)
MPYSLCASQRVSPTTQGKMTLMTDITRRGVFAAGALAVTAATAFETQGLSPIGVAMAQSAASSLQAPGFYRFKVGDITVTAINDGFAMRPLEGFVRNAELADVQKALANAFLPTTALPIPFTTLVLQTGGKLVLLDTGNGDMGAPTSNKWMSNFLAAGFDPKAVTTIVFSHFHGDHINGYRLKDGTSPFPNAEVIVPAAEWAFWMDDSRMAAAPEAMKGAFANVRRVFAPIAKDVKQIADGASPVAGVTAVAAYGHTPGHTAYRISSGTASMMFVADVTNHPALFVRNPDWSAVFDMDADMARATRRRILDMAASERAQLSFYHAPFPATGFIAKAGNGFEMVPVQWTSAT